jgi:epsilon-lactone hydrolase
VTALRAMALGLVFVSLLFWTLVMRLVGRRLNPAWNIFQEAVIRQMRFSFRRLMDVPDMGPTRRLMDSLGAAARVQGEKVKITPLAPGGPRGNWVTPTELGPNPGQGRVVLFLHGGGYVMCSPVTHRLFMARTARVVGARVLGLKYRLAPEHPFPAALDDAVAAYRWLLDTGHKPADILLVGDSAGGGLALATLKRLRDEGAPLPVGAALLSPWVDMAADDSSLRDNASVDYLGPMAHRMGEMATHYLGGADPKDPLASPLHGDLGGLPPLLLHAGGAEVLRGQVERLADRARSSGVEVELSVYPDMVHVWHAFAGVFPQAGEALEAVGAFARQRFAAATADTK